MATIDSLSERWHNYRPTKGQAFGFAAGCVVATLILGFGPGGWKTAGAASAELTEATAQARHELAAAVCAEEFMAAPDAKARLAALETLAWYQRGDKVAEAGFATMPDRKTPNTTVAIMCAARLSEQQAAGGGKT